ncbi:MAG: hypothetical protein ACYSWO_09435 [Planctomycetota bacterium]|jgi:hypothetical protein
MKHGIAAAIILVLATGCAKKQQRIRVTILSDPAGGKLYNNSGELLGPCPKVLRYDLDTEAMKRGYIETEPMTVRWPAGPEKKSDEPMRITVDGTNRHMVFAQPRNAPRPIHAVARAEEGKKSDEKQAQWQEIKKLQSANAKLIREELVRSSLKPAIPDEPAAKRPRRVLTLSQKQLVLLDWHSSGSRGARVKAKRQVAGHGVEFDIYFPSNSPGNCALSLVSSGTGGRGSLVGTDIRGYDEFALKLTLVSINGQRKPEMKQQLVAGAVIGPTPEGRRTGYEPVSISLADSEETVVARTAVSADEIYEIGFHVHVRNYQDWEPSGSKVVLRVEPVEEGRTDPFRASKG